MMLPKEKLDRVHEIAAQHIGQFSDAPDDKLELVMASESWSKAEREEAREILAENVFYCTSCGYYCDADDRYPGDLCCECVGSYT